MTDKELDELEARLRAAHLEYCESVAVGYSDPINPNGPEAADAIAELREKNAGLVGALEAIAAISAAPPSSDTGARLYAALDALDDARSLARTALKGKETP